MFSVTHASKQLTCFKNHILKSVIILILTQRKIDLNECCLSLTINKCFFIYLGLKAAEVSSLPSSIILDAREIVTLIARQMLVCTNSMQLRHFILILSKATYF